MTSPPNGHYIRGAFGEKISIPPLPSELELRSVIHALSGIMRFTGHTKEPYSVGQHCVLGARQLRNEGHHTATVRAFLCHDWAEVVVGDVSSPLKRAMQDRYYDGKTPHPSFLDPYFAIEHETQAVFARRFGFVYPFVDPVKNADLRMVVTEARDLLFGFDPTDWGTAEPYEDLKITPWIPERTRMELWDECRRTGVV